MKREAYIDPSQRYRYVLLRKWGVGDRFVTFIMLNPSTADGVEDDATIRRCIQYASDWAFDGLLVVNMFALRATDPDALFSVADPVGADNDEFIKLAVARSQVVVCAWGAHKSLKRFRGRRDAVLSIIRHAGREPMCLKRTKDGEPRHPLYLKGDLVLQMLEAA